jgi:hypothetical protein
VALKKIVHEICGRCGQQAATLLHDGRVQVGHNCAKPVPGPQPYPITYGAMEVIFVPKQAKLWHQLTSRTV